VYGTSSYQGFQYRHPFVTLHEVIHDDEGAQLAAGQLMTVQMLADLMIGLGRSVPIEILPERVLVRTNETMVWWLPAREHVMFFSDRGNDPVLKKMNGKRYPHPPLVFKVRGNRLWVRALKLAKRPNAETRMCVAPYWNCYDNGEVCTGSMKIPRERSVAALEVWQQSFFQSEFTHSSGTRKQTRFQGGLLGMWQSLERRKEFPGKYLVELPETLSQFVNNHDHSKRNEIQPGQ